MGNDEATNKFIASLFASSPTPIVAIDRNSLVTAWNPAAERLFGWSPDEVIGRLYPLVPEDGELQYRGAIDQVLNGQMISSYKARRNRKDGSLVDVSIALAPIRKRDGDITGILSIFNDITAQVYAEGRATRLNDILMAIREVNRLTVREKNSDRLVESAIRSLLKYRGYYKAWIALRSKEGGLELRAQAGLENFENGFNDAFRSDKFPPCIIQNLGTPGAHLVVDRQRTCAGCPLEHAYPKSEAIVALLEHNNNIRGILGLSLMTGLEVLEEERNIVAEIAGDIAFALNTIEVEKERQLEQANLRLAEEQAKQQREQLMQADKMVALGTLVSGVGHEINNPNNFVMLNVPVLKGMWQDVLQILDDHGLDDEEYRLRGIPFSTAREMIPQLLDDIMQGSWRIKRIVAELKDYARPQSTFPQEMVDINEVAKSAILLCNTFIKQHTQNFSTDFVEDIPQIPGISQRIEQVIINLLQNACEALTSNHEAVSIKISFDRLRDGVMIDVADEGMGISEKNLPQITDPFYTTKRSVGGTGLGLSIADRIIRDHKGELTFESSEGRGTVAHVFLPRLSEFQ